MFFKKNAMDVVEAAMKARSWKYARMAPDTIVTGFGTPNAMCFLVARHDVGRNTLLFLFNPAKGPVGAFEAMTAGQPPFVRIHCDDGYSEEQVTKISEFLLAENYRLLLGAFERDASDGELRFRIALPFPDGAPTVQQINWCIDMGCSTVTQTMLQVAAMSNKTTTMI